MITELKKRYTEIIIEFVREKWHGPVCETILKGAVSLALEHLNLDLTTPTTPEDTEIIISKVNAYLGVVTDCKNDYCLTCRVNKTVANKSPGPSLIKGRWQELLLWITALLSNIATNEEVDQPQRTAAEDAIFVLAWIGAQAKVGEDSMVELAELHDENKRLKDAVSALTEHRGGKWAN
jgi:hypothetical protein